VYGNYFENDENDYFLQNVIHANNKARINTKIETEEMEITEACID